VILSVHRGVILENVEASADEKVADDLIDSIEGGDIMAGEVEVSPTIDMPKYDTGDVDELLSRYDV